MSFNCLDTSSLTILAGREDEVVEVKPCWNR